MPDNSEEETTNAKRLAQTKYHTPSITEYGSLSTLTQGAKGTGTSDTKMGNNEPNKT